MSSPTPQASVFQSLLLVENAQPSLHWEALWSNTLLVFVVLRILVHDSQDLVTSERSCEGYVLHLPPIHFLDPWRILRTAENRMPLHFHYERVWQVNGLHFWQDLDYSRLCPSLQDHNDAQVALGIEIGGLDLGSSVRLRKIGTLGLAVERCGGRLAH